MPEPSSKKRHRKDDSAGGIKSVPLPPLSPYPDPLEGLIGVVPRDSRLGRMYESSGQNSQSPFRVKVSQTSVSVFAHHDALDNK